MSTVSNRYHMPSEPQCEIVVETVCPIIMHYQINLVTLRIALLRQ